MYGGKKERGGARFGEINNRPQVGIRRQKGECLYIPVVVFSDVLWVVIKCSLCRR